MNASGQSNSISGRVLNQNTKESVEYASVVLFKQDSVFLNGTTADSIGRFVFTNLTSDDYVLSVSCMGFEAKKILLQNLSESAEIDVLLNESVLSLGEIVISASSTINKINQRIVFPTKLQLNHSANGMQLLNTMMVRPYRRYNKYSIGKLLGKCSNIYLSSPAYLPTKGRQGV